MMLKQIKKSFEVGKLRGFTVYYYYFDIHETILYPDYTNTKPLKFYPYAKEALQLMTKHPMLVSILYTCSHPEEIENYLKFFKDHGIEFKYVNENPDVENTKYGDFSKKPYMNCLFDDKSGFEAEKEWRDIYYYFRELLYGEIPMRQKLMMDNSIYGAYAKVENSTEHGVMGRKGWSDHDSSFMFNGVKPYPVTISSNYPDLFPIDESIKKLVVDAVKDPRSPLKMHSEYNRYRKMFLDFIDDTKDNLDKATREKLIKEIEEALRQHKTEAEL